MKYKLFVLTALLVFSGAFSSCNNVDYMKEEEKVKEVWYKIAEYGTKGDWENYKKYIDQSEKIQVIHPGEGEWLKGWDEVSPKYKAMLESGNTWIEHKNELLNVNISKSGDMAWANAVFTFSLNSNPEQKHHMWESVVFEKNDGKCKIVMLTSSINPQDVNKSKEYAYVKKYINKPLSQENLEKLDI
jgi:ketosteroid isomerase-like protein